MTAQYRAGLGRLPYDIVRDQDQPLSLAITRGGVVEAVLSGTITIRDEAGAKAVDADPIVVGGSGEATYALLATSVPDTLAFSTKWSVDWDLTFASGRQLFSKAAFLLRRPLHPVVDATIIVGDPNDDTVVGRHDDLLIDDVVTVAEAQGHLDEAWADIMGWLIEDGHPPHKALSPEALAEMHADQGCHRLLRKVATYATGQAGKYKTESREYGEEARNKYARLRLPLDANEDGTADGTTANLPPLYGVQDNIRGAVVA